MVRVREHRRRVWRRGSRTSWIRVKGHTRIRGKSNRTRDKMYKARKPGKRTSQKGRVYYETRRNRVDRKPKSRL